MAQIDMRMGRGKEVHLYKVNTGWLWVTSVIMNPGCSWTIDCDRKLLMLLDPLLLWRMQNAVYISDGSESTKVNSDWNRAEDWKEVVYLKKQRQATKRQYVFLSAYITGHEGINIRANQPFKKIDISLTKENGYKTAVNKFRLEIRTKSLTVMRAGGVPSHRLNWSNNPLKWGSLNMMVW